MAEGTSVSLSVPITAHGESIDVLTFRAATLKDLRQLDNVRGDIGKVAKLIEVLAGIPPSSVDQIAGKDLPKISEVLADFLGGSTLLGGTSPRS